MCGEKRVKGKLKVSEKDFIKPYFDGTPGYEQIKSITPGKIYEVVKVESYGDCEDVTIINDFGTKENFADFFFEEVGE